MALGPTDPHKKLRLIFMAPQCMRLFHYCKQITSNKDMSEQDTAPKHMQTEGEGRAFQPGLGFRLGLITNPNFSSSQCYFWCRGLGGACFHDLVLWQRPAEGEVIWQKLSLKIKWLSRFSGVWDLLPSVRDLPAAKVSLRKPCSFSLLTLSSSHHLLFLLLMELRCPELRRCLWPIPVFFSQVCPHGLALQPSPTIHPNQETIEKYHVKPCQKYMARPLRSTKINSGWVFLPGFHHKAPSSAIKPPKGV